MNTSETRIAVDRARTPPPGRSRPGRWVWLVVAALVFGFLSILRGDVEHRNDSSTPPVSVDISTTTTEPPLTGVLSTGWMAIDLPGRGEVTEIVATADGWQSFIASSEGTAVWRSADGLRWEAVPDPAGVFRGGRVNAAVETEDGLVAVGAWTDPDEQYEFFWGATAPEIRPAVWQSPDGRSWTRLPAESIEVPPAEPDRGAMLDVIDFEGRLVAVGWSSSIHHQGMAWVSDDGGDRWRAAAEELDGTRTVYTDVTGVSLSDEGLLAVGTSLNRPFAWVSPDGLLWTVLESGEAWGRSFYHAPARVVAASGGLVAAGTRARPESAYSDPPDAVHPISWISQDGRDWLHIVHEEMEGVRFESLAAVDPWLLAGGSLTEGYLAAPGIWYSATGAEWEQVLLAAPHSAWTDAHVNTLVRGGPGLIAGGTLEGMPEVWVWSPDRTREAPEDLWTRPETGRWMWRSSLGGCCWEITGTPDGLLAVGDGVVQVSVDGVEWESWAFAEAGLDAGFWYSSLVWMNGSLYKAGSGVDSFGVWRSTDNGRTWTLLAETVGGSRELFEGGEGELIAIEYPPCCEEGQDDSPQLLRSSDGATWTDVPLPEVEWITSVSFVGNRYVVAGWLESGPWIWTSAGDGQWEAVYLDTGLDFADRMVAFGGRLFVPGTRWSEDLYSTVLSSDDGLVWQPDGDQFTGYLYGLVKAGPGLAMIENEADESQSWVTVWASADGHTWENLRPLPIHVEQWARIVPGTERILVFTEGEGGSHLWEWIPPQEE